jgi:transposase
MRGSDAVTGSLFSYVDVEARIPKTHPLRLIREIVNEVLAALSGEFDRMYAPLGRPSIPPERLLRGLLIQAFYTIRSERLLMESLDYNLLFRWFVGLGIDDPVWDHSTYSKNRDRLLEADIARKFLKEIVAHPKVAPLLSDEHFTVDGTLMQAWASLKSFVAKEETRPTPPDDANGARQRPAGETAAAPAQTTASETTAAKTTAEEKRSEEKTPEETTADTPPTDPATTATDASMPSPAAATETEVARSRNEDVDFHGQKRSNATHVSTTDPEARLFRKGPGKEAKLSFMGHAMTENRHGLVVETAYTQATGTAEREAALAMIDAHLPGSERRVTVGADKGYDVAGFVADLRQMCVTPHIAAKSKSSAIDGRTTRHAGYALSQRKRKLVEEPFGWGKTIGGLARVKMKGAARQGFAFTFVMAAYDLVRLPKLVGGFRHGLAAGPQAA